MRSYPVINGPQSDALRLYDVAATADTGSTAPAISWLFDVPALTVYFEQAYNGSYNKIDLYLDEAQTTQIAETTTDHATICTLGGYGNYTTEGRLTFVAGEDTHTGTIDFTSISPYPKVAGTIPGVIVSEVSETNGTGAGALRCRSGGLSWRAPGSSTFGPETDAATDGTYYLFDGDDYSAWIAVVVDASFLTVGAQANVYLSDRYNNLFDDITYEEFDLLTTKTRLLGIYNPSRTWLTSVKIWNASNPAESDHLTVKETTSTVTPTSAAKAGLRNVRPSHGNTILIGTSAPAAAGITGMLDWLRFSWAGE